MDERQRARTSHAALDDPRWLIIALALMGAHQIQSAVVDRNELRFRLTTLTVAALTPLTLRLPPRIRGVIWIAIGIPPFFGAWVAHLIPIVRDRVVPPASETAPLNLAGASFLIALGVALLRSPPETPVVLPQSETIVV